ncbi:hypothetical protein [Acinetobacter rudis]|uniref:hypothetical protein n=1 Tax=Acinetobacter rudis TaxID=632955 RepID=UPI0033407700
MGRRIEQAVGRVLFDFLTSRPGYKGGLQPYMFMPNEDKPKEESLEDYMERNFGG